jgi:eukaryotic-like serine/threonine-protein kinase
MRSATVILSVTQGSLAGKEYVFDRSLRCVVGRAPDCTLQLPNDSDHANISRHHCLLEIDPPAIRVVDLNSRNGTFVNGDRIESQPGIAKTDLVNSSHAEVGRPLGDGDQVQIGKAVLQVGVIPPLEEPDSC